MDDGLFEEVSFFFVSVCSHLDISVCLRLRRPSVSRRRDVRPVLIADRSGDGESAARRHYVLTADQTRLYMNGEGRSKIEKMVC